MAFEIVDGMTGTKHISSDDLAALNTATVGKADCVLKYGNDFALTMASANSATLGTGVGMVGGKRFWNQAATSLTIQSGTQGQKRNDLVVARYAKTSAGIESITPVVVKGTPTTGTPADPSTTANDLKLWRVPLNGITVGAPVKLFSPVMPLATLGDSVSQIVAKGTNGIWTYTKYADGSAECYGTMKHSLTKTGTFWLSDVKLPFPFIKPANTYKSFTIVVAGGEYFAHNIYPHYPLEEASVSTVRCAVADATESDSIAINYIVRGRWRQ